MARTDPKALVRLAALFGKDLKERGFRFRSKCRKSRPAQDIASAADDGDVASQRGKKASELDSDVSGAADHKLLGNVFKSKTASEVIPSSMPSKGGNSGRAPVAVRIVRARASRHLRR
jgi:hypothetical protein